MTTIASKITTNMSSMDFDKFLYILLSTSSLTFDQLNHAIQNKPFFIRIHAVMNHNMTLDLLDLAMNDKSQRVRYQAYHNPNTTDEMKMLYRLSHIENKWFWKRDPYVRR